MPEYDFRKFPPANLLIQLIHKKFNGVLLTSFGQDELRLFFSKGYPVKSILNNQQIDINQGIIELFDFKWSGFSLKNSDFVEGEPFVPFNSIKKAIKLKYDKIRLLKDAKELIGKKLSLKKGFQNYTKFLTFNQVEASIMKQLENTSSSINQISENTNAPIADVLSFIYTLASLGILYASDGLSASVQEQNNSEELPQYIKTLLTNLEFAKNDNYFIRMQLSLNASMDKVNARFKEFAKQFHPDVVVNKGYDEYKDKAEEFFRLITEAFNGLLNPDEREKHRNEENIQKENKEEVQNILKAEMLYQQAVISFHKQDYASAEELLKKAIKKVPNDGGYIGLWAWVSYLNPEHNKNSIRENIKTALKQAIEFAPKEANLYYYLGKVLSDANQIGSAKQYLARALELNSDHLEAARLLRLLERHKRSQQNGILTTTGSFLSNIFKKK